MISRLIRMLVKGKLIAMVLRWLRGRSRSSNTGSATPGT